MTLIGFGFLVLFVIFLLASMLLDDGSSCETATKDIQTSTRDSPCETATHRSPCENAPQPRGTVAYWPDSNNEAISRITPHLYISNFQAAKDYQKLKCLGIDQILVIGEELPRHGEPHFNVMHVKLRDSSEENIKKHFNSTYRFINRGRTLIHCFAGISRSVTIATAYLMRKHNMSFVDAATLIKSKRKIANPNPGFIKQLQKFDEELKNKPMD